MHALNLDSVYYSKTLRHALVLMVEVARLEPKVFMILSRRWDFGCASPSQVRQHASGLVDAPTRLIRQPPNDRLCLGRRGG